MKALIRNEGETVTQDMGHSFINWNTGAPLTDSDWCGGPYRLVDETLPEIRSSESEGAVTESPSTVSYGGKEYTLEELKKLIG